MASPQRSGQISARVAFRAAAAQLPASARGARHGSPAAQRAVAQLLRDRDERRSARRLALLEQAVRADDEAREAGRSYSANNDGGDDRKDARRRRRILYGARSWLWQRSSLPRVRRCGCTPTSDAVAVGVGQDGRSSLIGVQSCGSIWACPVCAAKIEARRTDELREAIEAHVRRGDDREGGDVLFLTLTMRHEAGQSLAELWDGLSSAWQAAMGGYRAARKARDDAGVRGWIRRVEATHGRNGWHLHVHALVFVGRELSAETLAHFEDKVFDAWRARLRKVGLAPPLRRYGIKLARVATGGVDERAGVVGAYMAKGYFESAAAEVGASSGKRGRFGSRVPFEVLADAVDGGSKRDLALWREWERASCDRRSLTWSRGLRAELLPDAEDVSDEAIAAEWEEHVAPRVKLDGPAFRAVVRAGLLVTLLDAAEREDWQVRCAALIRCAVRRARAGPRAPGRGS